MENIFSEFFEISEETLRGYLEEALEKLLRDSLDFFFSIIERCQGRIPEEISEDTNGVILEGIHGRFSKYISVKNAEGTLEEFLKKTVEGISK